MASHNHEREGEGCSTTRPKSLDAVPGLRQSQSGDATPGTPKQPGWVDKISRQSSVEYIEEEDMNKILGQNDLHYQQLLAMNKGLGASVHGSDAEFEMDDIAGSETWYGRLKRPFAGIFLTLESESSSRIAWVLSWFIKGIILLAIFTGIIASEPICQYTPATCLSPACHNDPKLCPNSMICEPQPFPVFDTIDAICIYIFTVEYGLKLLSVWSVSPLAAGILPPKEETIAQQLIKKNEAKLQFGFLKPLTQTFRYMIKFKSLVDLACWLPFYVTSASSINSQTTGFLRVLRLLRLIRVMRLLDMLHMFEQMYVMSEILMETVRSCYPVITVFLFFSFMGTILLGSIIYIFESGTWTVDKAFPEGAYVRPTISGHDTEVSPYISVGTSFYWVIVTGATVGYGDLVPTSKIGRALASLTCIMGILGVAFPVGVLGSSFKRIYDLHFEKLRNRIVAKKKRVAREAGPSKHPRRDSAVKSGKQEPGSSKGGSLKFHGLPKRGIHPTPPLAQQQRSGKEHGSHENQSESIPHRESAKLSVEKMEPIKEEGVFGLSADEQMLLS